MKTSSPRLSGFLWVGAGWSGPDQRGKRMANTLLRCTQVCVCVSVISSFFHGAALEIIQVMVILSCVRHIDCITAHKNVCGVALYPEPLFCIWEN